MARTQQHRRLEAATAILARIQYYSGLGELNGSESVTIGGFPICSQGMLKKFLEENSDHPQFEALIKKELERIAKNSNEASRA